MHVFKIALAFSSMAALTLADTGTVKLVDIISGVALIRPDQNGDDVGVKLVCHVCPKHVSQAREQAFTETLANRFPACISQRATRFRIILSMMGRRRASVL
jgi:hypothetical protein